MPNLRCTIARPVRAVARMRRAIPCHVHSCADRHVLISRYQFFSSVFGSAICDFLRSAPYFKLEGPHRQHVGAAQRSQAPTRWLPVEQSWIRESCAVLS